MKNVSKALLVGVTFPILVGCSSTATYEGPYEIIYVIQDSALRCFPDDLSREAQLQEIDNGWILDCNGWDVRLADSELPKPSEEICQEYRDTEDARVDELTTVVGPNWYATGIPNGGEWPAHAPETAVADALGGEIMSYREFQLRGC